MKNSPERDYFYLYKTVNKKVETVTLRPTHHYLFFYNPAAGVLNMSADRIILPLQETSLDTWSQKYQLRGADGTPLEAGLDEAKDRVATALASVERRQYRKAYEKKFRDACRECVDRFALHLDRIAERELRKCEVFGSAVL